MPNASPSRPSLGAALQLAIVAGLSAGALELFVRALLKVFENRFLGLTRLALWAIPTTLLVLGGVLILGTWLLGRWVRPLGGWRSMVGIAAAWAVFSPLFTFYPRFHWAALSLIVMGFAVQWARFAGRRQQAIRRPLGRAAALVALVVPAGVGTAVVVERRARVSPPPAGTVAPAGAPNILLLVLDTVRAFDLSVYGYERPTTPFLEELAREGAAFDWAFSPAPWTLPTHASMFTGRWPSELHSDWLSPMRREPTTLAELLLEKGYRTGGFVANLQATSAETGVAQGFERYEDRPPKLDLVFRASSIGLLVLNPRLMRRFGDWSVGRKRAPEVRRRFLRWVETDDARPFFAFLNFFDAHIPYDPSDEHRGRFGELTERSSDLRTRGAIRDSVRMRERRARYDEAIATIDQEIRRTMDRLRSQGLLDNTIVIVTSDHGELFGEHGLQGHGHSLYTNEIRVPLLIWAPGRVDPAVRISQPVTLKDVGRTVLDLAGLPADFGGRSLVPLMAGDTTATGSPVLSMVTQIPDRRSRSPVAKGDMVAIIRDSLLYVLGGDSTVELFRLRRDALEGDPITDIDPATLASLESGLWSIWAGRASLARPLREGSTIAEDVAMTGPRPRRGVRLAGRITSSLGAGPDRARVESAPNRRKGHTP